MQYYDLETNKFFTQMIGGIGKNQSPLTNIITKFAQNQARRLKGISEASNWEDLRMVGIDGMWEALKKDPSLTRRQPAFWICIAKRAIIGKVNEELAFKRRKPPIEEFWG